jgi:DNA-directed RNA polymerase alpha subunit
LLEQDKWRDVLQLRKHKTHFIFTVESTGAMTPDELVVRALDILREKAAKLGGRL